jgi:hypothetical protein
MTSGQLEISALRDRMTLRTMTQKWERENRFDDRVFPE